MSDLSREPWPRKRPQMVWPVVTPYGVELRAPAGNVVLALPLAVWQEVAREVRDFTGVDLPGLPDGETGSTSYGDRKSYGDYLRSWCQGRMQGFEARLSALEKREQQGEETTNTEAELQARVYCSCGPYEIELVRRQHSATLCPGCGVEYQAHRH